MSGNKSIGCSVRECKFHVESSNLCSLENIMVTKHGQGKSIECTDCASFKARN
ncbi:protein of unknown function [Desulfonispora thiosulfatigenes DSM 11270]|uniref:DUF1540 domain-containing protein n=1 Tax=Desulfonispora thiosulfatigenes DSM 11270 TaxID=656914 RepID=A0A1W1UJW4_DESTI|nr:DUF1540 domain-containing protein [Desulfonispora thiosulfatigenes]SMB81386.1 protein of unknown function [Desulfonispora thiosulfatigenes DSM 11270]